MSLGGASLPLVFSTISGRPLLCSIVHDISARKKAEKDRESLIKELKRQGNYSAAPHLNTISLKNIGIL